ncbi:WPP domain-containing protein 1-like [Phragmites australis]|uniref:WPP domain-containing protein 1-like n=1 Tax=Phragmites australis TaxID=29695 RepID=UPI002D781C41|nr:WPP domain-containing protein 1-like [Phragmites australis]
MRASRTEANQTNPVCKSPTPHITHTHSLSSALHLSPHATPQISSSSSSLSLSLSLSSSAMAEGAPNAAAEGSQPAPPEGSADAPPASGAKAAEALLPSLSIWPPSQRTRDAVVRRLVQTLAAPSVLSQRYGAFPEPEAERAAAAVEAEAFAAASESAAGASPASVEEGIEVLQAYSKEVSRRLLELAKSRAAAAAAPAEASAQESEDSSATAPPPAEAAASDE